MVQRFDAAFDPESPEYGNSLDLERASIVNPYYTQTLDAQSNAAADVVGGAVASVVDFGATAINSLTFGAADIDTASVLSRISDDALRVYQENPDTIKTASFIGGLFVPSAIALKGMQMLKSGTKAMSMFSTERRAADLKQLQELAAQGPGATKAFNQMRNAMYARQAAGQVLDATAMELAVIGATNEHPYMEDYVEDPIKNFGISVALGGVIGAGLGHVVDRFAVGQAVGTAQRSALMKVTEGYQPVNPGSYTVDKLQVHQANIDNIKSMLNNTDEPLDGLAKEYATRFLERETAAQEEAFNSFMGNLVKDRSTEEVQALRDLFYNDIRFQHIDSVKAAKIAERDKLVPPQGVQSSDVFGSLYSKNSKGLDTANTRVWVPELGGFVHPTELNRVGRADAIKGVSLDTLQSHASISGNKIQAADQDALLLLNNLPTPSVDKFYAEALTYVDSLKSSRLATAALGVDDLAMKQAVLMRMRKEIQGGSMSADATVTITKSQPIYSEELVTEALGRAGVAPDYAKKLNDLAYAGAAANDPRGLSSLSKTAKDLLTGWTRGNRVSEFRTVADAYFYKGYGRSSLSSSYESSFKAFEEIYNSPSAVAFREKIAQLADPEGYVYLWRGMKEDAKGHASVASYTSNYDQANQGFARGQGAKLYRIHKDDVLFNIVDDAGAGYGKSNTGGEILVRAPSHPTEPFIPTAGNGNVPMSKAIPNTSTTRKVTAQELAADIIDQKTRMIQHFAKQGLDPLEMAIRTNTPVESVQKVLLGKPLGAEDTPPFEYHSIQALKDKLNAANQPLAMRANTQKRSWGAVQANMDVATQNRINNQVIGDILRQSNTTAAQALYAELFQGSNKKLIDIVRAQVVQAVNGFGGNRFLQSADSTFAHLKDIGSFATYFGQRLEHLTNNIMQEALKPLEGSLSKIASNVAHRSEIAQAMQVNASLRGWRTYHDRKFWQMAEEMDPATGKMRMVEQMVRFNGKPFTVQSEDVDKVLTALGQLGNQQYKTRNTIHKILGKPDMNNIGFWLPAFNPRNKYIGYIHDAEQQVTQMVVGNTAEELQESLRLLRSAHAERVANGKVLIFDKKSQEYINIVKGRDDPIFMSVANEDLLHKGSSSPAFIRTNADPLAELIGGFEHSIVGAVTELAEVSLWDVSDGLRRISELNKAASANQPLNRIKAAIYKPKDTAGDLRKTMFNLRSLPDYTAWQDANNWFEAAVGYGAKKLTDAWKAIRPNRVEGISYEEYKDILKKANVHDQFAAFGAEAEAIYKQSLGTDIGNQASRMVTLANGYAATSALRFGDIAQPLVNAMSLPILMTAGILDKFPSTFMGVAKKAEIKGMLGVGQIMHDGIRAMNSSVHAGLNQLWKERGYFDSIVSEASDVLSLPRDLTPGLMTSMEKALKHKIITEYLAKPADKMETLTRQVAMNTGAVLAKRLYPGMSDAGVTIFAKNFMDRVIGNYHSAQRPVFFQGTMGVAMGLFQTYMLTFLQAMYKQLQLGNKRALGMTLLMQGGVFGSASLPGFNQVSAMIGQHYSDDHVDLKTGTIRAVSDPIAKMVLYGLPSSLGPAMYTRGELAPRVSTPANLEALPQVQMLGQTLSTVGGVISALGAPTEDIPRSLMQAISLQSVNRPLARAAELASGYSVTTQGSTVSTPDEVWTTTGVISRLLGARPTEEALAREALHLNRFYESNDRENRQKVVNKLRTAIRAGTDDPEKIDKLALDYMDEGGTPTGWRSAVRQAILTTDMPLNETLKDKLKDDSGLNILIDSLDDQ